MKKIVFSLIGVMFVSFVLAQTNKDTSNVKKYIYCDLQGRERLLSSSISSC